MTQVLFVAGAWMALTGLNDIRLRRDARNPCLVAAYMASGSLMLAASLTRDQGDAAAIYTLILQAAIVLPATVTFILRERDRRREAVVAEVMSA